MQNGVTVKRDDTFTDEPIASTAIATSDTINIQKSKDISIHIKATSAGVVNLLVEFLGSPVDVVADFAKPVTYEDISVTVETPIFSYISIPATRYLRVRITGQAGNDASTTVTAYVQHS